MAKGLEHSWIKWTNIGVLVAFLQEVGDKIFFACNLSNVSLEGYKYPEPFVSEADGTK